MEKLYKDNNDINFIIESKKKWSKQPMFKKHEKQVWDDEEPHRDYDLRYRNGSLDSGMSSGMSSYSGEGSGDEGWGTPPREQPSPVANDKLRAMDEMSDGELAPVAMEQQEKQQQKVLQKPVPSHPGVKDHKDMQRVISYVKYHDGRKNVVEMKKVAPESASTIPLTVRSDTQARLHVVGKKEVVPSVRKVMHPYARDSYPNDAGLRRRPLHAGKTNTLVKKPTPKLSKESRKPLAPKTKSKEKFALKYIPVYKAADVASDLVKENTVKKVVPKNNLKKVVPKTTIQYANNSFPLRRELTRKPLRRNFKYIPVYQSSK